MTREIVLATEIGSEPKAVHGLVATPEGLAGFWTSDVQGAGGEGGELTFGFPAAPTRMPATVTRDDPGSAIDWAFGGDWPFWNGTTASWTFEPSDAGTNVTFRHAGYADEMPDFAFGSVAITWALVVARLRQVAESGTPDPALG